MSKARRFADVFCRFKTDIFRADVGVAFAGGAGADKADVGAAALVRAVTKIVAGLIGCLLLLSSGASATTFAVATTPGIAGDKNAARAQNWAGVGAVASANTTGKCGAGTKTRIKPLILVVASGITWQNLQSQDSYTKNYLMGYPATPMNLVIRGHKDGANFNEQLAMLFSGRRDKFTRKYRNDDIINSPLAKTLKAAGCTFAIDPSLTYRYYYTDGKPLKRDLADVTVVKAVSDSAGQIASKLRILKARYGSSVDVMTVSIAAESSLSGGDDRLYLALIPSLHGASGAEEKIRVPSTHQNNLVQLTDISTTIAARYGAKLPERASGQALAQNPQSINKSVFAGNRIDTLEQEQNSSDNPATTKVTSARQALIHSLINQDKHARASRAVMVYNTIIIVVFTLAVVRLWRRKSLERRVCGIRGIEFSGKQLLSLQRLSIFTAVLSVGYLLINLVPWYSMIITWSYTIGDSVYQVVDTFKTVALQVVTATAGAALIALVLTALINWLTRKSVSYSTGFIVAAALNGLIWFGDGISGNHLTFNSPLTMNALVAGRFYGVSNTAFAFGAVGAMIALLAWADWLKSRYSMRISLLAVSGVGLLLVIADAAPFLGADLGGALALIPTLGVALVKLSGRSLHPRILALLGLISAGLLSGVAILEWLLRGENSTHLGRFGGQLLDGTFLATIGKKFKALVGPFIDANGQIALMIVKIIVALAVVSIVLAVWLRLYRATRRQGVPEVYRLQLDTLTVLLLLEVGLNDSGASMAVYSLFLLVPLACLMSLELPAKQQNQIEILG
jgi:hypothetical protein avisC_05522